MKSSARFHENPLLRYRPDQTFIFQLGRRGSDAPALPGEYYFKQKSWVTAAYAYRKYLEYNPGSTHVMQARQRLAQLAPFLKAQPQQPQQQAQGAGFARVYEEGDVIFLEHEIGNELYIIQEGGVKIKKVVANNEITLAILQKGDIFGEMAILDDKPRSATAVAYGRAVLLAVNKTNFQGMVQQQPQLATKIITLLSERIWTSYRQFANAVIDDPAGKISICSSPRSSESHPLDKEQRIPSTLVPRAPR